MAEQRIVNLISIGTGYRTMRWKIPYNLKFVSGASYDDPLPTTTNTEEKYLVVAGW